MDVIVPRASFGRLGLCVVASLLLVALFRSVALGGHCLGVVGLSLCLRQFLPLDRPCILGLGRGFLGDGLFFHFRASLFGYVSPAGLGQALPSCSQVVAARQRRDLGGCLCLDGRSVYLCLPPL